MTLAAAAEARFERRRETSRRRAARERRTDRTGKIDHGSAKMSAADKRQAELLLAALPRDTRGLTARLMGNPINGRSALDRRGI